MTHVIGRAKTTAQKKVVKAETAARAAETTAPVRNPFLEATAAVAKVNQHLHHQNQPRSKAVRAETVARAVETTVPVKNLFPEATAAVAKATNAQKTANHQNAHQLIQLSQYSSLIPKIPTITTNAATE